MQHEQATGSPAVVGNVLEQPDSEAGLDRRPAVLAVERCDLAVDPVPIDLAGKLNQLVLWRCSRTPAQTRK